jgi:hypothetical protein
MTHTVLGDRWVYDGCHDPVNVTALVRTILTGGGEADLYAATDAGLVLEPATTRVRGSGSLASASVPALTAPEVSYDGTTTTLDAGVRLTLPRVIITTTPAANAALSGTWPGQEPLSCWRPWTVRSDQMCVRSSDHQPGAAPSGARNRAPDDGKLGRRLVVMNAHDLRHERTSFHARPVAFGAFNRHVYAWTRCQSSRT